jgi:hypothetical protein
MNIPVRWTTFHCTPLFSLGIFLEHFLLLIYVPPEDNLLFENLKTPHSTVSSTIAPPLTDPRCPNGSHNHFHTSAYHRLEATHMTLTSTEPNFNVSHPSVSAARGPSRECPCCCVAHAMLIARVTS